ncbi:NAD(P)H-hydrate epimerase [Candidatus Micrarchaeota archaeon]|nr:NAD(P)H-hydrate epimerase [Candidatus Micrarchaeota archaeon]MBU1681864.1 NAD(P)H-hydrate epimerase [Candidatus Micrarchaeota archaeon]
MDFISVQEMRKLEEKAFARGVSILELMEEAGKNCAMIIESKLGTGKKIIVFTGPGNNGGDGLVAARYLRQKNQVKIILVKDPKTDASRKNLEQVKNSVGLIAQIEEADIIIDAMLGFGARGALRGEIKDTCKMINKMKGFKVAIDMPTGLDADSGEVDPDVIISDATICLHKCKVGVAKAGKEIVGELWIVPIGL